ncbi:unnamed protein product [Rhizophagus irregularis]|nr:unnamed protein product [Rhizophagus irregularis]
MISPKKHLKLITIVTIHINYTNKISNGTQSKKKDCNSRYVVVSTPLRAYISKNNSSNTFCTPLCERRSISEIRTIKKIIIEKIIPVTHNY